jgi:hypothetical protein
MIDQQLEAAELTKENLLTQKQRLKAIQTRINTLASKLICSSSFWIYSYRIFNLLFSL